MAVLIAMVAAVVTPARAADQPPIDAQMLLDLDLLTDGDPARHRDQSVAERLRMLELLRLLESPAAATPARAARPPATPAPPAPPPEGGAK
jgi:hypothetical protein